MTDTTPFSAVELNRRGLMRYQRGDVAGALADFEEAAALEPEYAVAWNNAGLVRQMLGRTADAVADFDRAIAARPDYAEALANRGRARQTLGDSAGALADFDRAMGFATGTFAAAVLHNRAGLKQQRGDLAGALADFDRAVALDPEQPATYVNRGTARKEAGDLDGALADFERALALNPLQGLAAAYHGQGGVRALQNDFAGAIADYDRALDLEPDNFFFYISRGNARYHRRDPRGVADYRIALRLNPEAAAKEFVRLLAADVRRDADAVLANCAKHLRLSDRDLLARARRALTLILLGRDAEALDDLEVIRGAVPDLRACLERLIELAQRERRPVEGPTAWANVLGAVFADYGA